MLRFRNWLRAAEHDKLNESKSKRRPDNRVDDFLDQLIGLAGDMDKASKAKPKDLPTKPSVKATPGEQQLLDLAKVVMANLRSSPDYYKTKAADLKAGGAQANNTGKVTRNDAIRAARELGIDFRNTEFDQEAFRKGIEMEFNRRSAFSRDYDPSKRVV